MKPTVNLPPGLYEAADGLIQNLLASEPFLAYRQAKANLDADSNARSLLQQLAKLQAHLRQKQMNGGVTQADIDALRALQTQVQTNAAIISYAQSQQAAVDFLRTINQEISQLLGIDFASLARNTTC